METKNNLAWNDCEKCKHYNFCYCMPQWTENKALDDFNMAVSSRKRNMCVNNGKRLFVGKEKKD